MNKRDKSFSGEELVIAARADRLSGLFLRLQQGVILRKEVGCTVRSFLYNQLKLSPEFVEDNIQTIFLDGKPVDDLDAALVKHGCTLALSSAMPGLVGATMRRGGYYASLRSGISYSSEAGIAPPAAQEGYITLKLFNLIAEYLGKTILQDGIFIKREDLEDLLGRQPGAGPDGVEAIHNGMPLDREAFRADGRAGDLVRVRLKIK